MQGKQETAMMLTLSLRNRAYIIYFRLQYKILHKSESIMKFKSTDKKGSKCVLRFSDFVKNMQILILIMILFYLISFQIDNFNQWNYYMEA